MPRNNLSEHIKWLLSEKPFIPPAVSLITYDPDAPTSSSSFSQSSSFRLEQTSNNEPESAIVRPTVQPTPPSSSPEPQPALSTSELTAGDIATAMARLRATPGNGKPRLRVAEIPDYGILSASTAKHRGQDLVGTRNVSLSTTSIFAC